MQSETITEGSSVAIPEPDALEAMTASALRVIAEELGLDVPSKAPKVVLLEVIADKRVRREEPDAIEGELVEEPTVAEVEADAESEAESKALALRERPVVQVPALLPSVGEFHAMREMADAVANTQMVPKAYRGKPDDVLAAILTGREMGLGPMESLRELSVIDGKPSLSANLLMARLRAGGVKVLESSVTPERAWIRAQRRDTGEIAEVEWTYEQALAAGLPGKANWQHYREDMLWARCVGRLARRLGGDLIAGVMPYTSEEVQDWDDYEGTPPESTWIAPEDWPALGKRLTKILGDDETPAWMGELARLAYGEPTISDVDKSTEISDERKADLWQRVQRVLRTLEEAGYDPDTLTLPTRNTIQLAFAQAFDNTIALNGPAWALTASEAESYPQKDDVLGAPEKASGEAEEADPDGEPPEIHPDQEDLLDSDGNPIEF
jgi:hypothetical protein